jgi:hypothetical protein
MECLGILSAEDADALEKAIRDLRAGDGVKMDSGSTHISRGG